MTPEMCSQIAMLAPLAMFRQLQIVCRVFKLSPAQQFMVRCRERKLMISSSATCKSYNSKLTYGETDSKKDGACIYVYHDATTEPQCLLIHCINGLQHGTFHGWYQSGQLLLRVTYIDGKLHGDYCIWYKSGQLSEQIAYIDGKRHGKYCSWYESGQLHNQYMYNDGMRDGECISWYGSGQIFKHRIYSNGKVVQRMI